MRKQLAEIKEIERYLLQEMPAASRLVFQARMLVTPALRNEVRCQQKAMQLVQWLARQEQHEKLDTVFQRLMKEDTFHHSITAIFR
jgi:hypothetical protein